MPHTHLPRGSVVDKASQAGVLTGTRVLNLPVPTGEGYGAPQASSETDLLDRFILLKPKPSQGDSSEAKTPPQ